MISIDTLVDIYNRWGDKENLQPLSSADEQMRKDNITNKQRDWLIKFIRVWDIIEDHYYEKDFHKYIDPINKEKK